VAGAGDVDGDGLGDLIVGAPGNGAGAAAVYAGSNGSLLHAWQGQAAGDRFGHAVAGAGDLDGDGRADLLVGAPSADEGGQDAGSVYAFSGSTGQQIQSLSGSEPGDDFGNSLSSAGPDTLSADNEGDVIIGASKGRSDGRGYVQVRSRPDLALRLVVEGELPGDRFGASVALVGDVNGDQVGDLLVGSDPRDGLDLPLRAGAARLLSGADGSLLATYADGTTGSGYGSTVSGVGDVTGDGVPDVAVGSPSSGELAADAGSLRIYSGADGLSWYVLHGSQTQAALGTGAACVGDLNGDGTPDVAVAEPGSGLVHVMSVSRWNEVESGLPGVDGIPRLIGEGGLVADAEAELRLTNARPGTVAMLVLGYALTIDPATGTLVPTADIVDEGLGTSQDGTLVYSFTWPDGLSSGDTIYYQFLIWDPEAPGGESRSNTVAAVVP
jgi:hypothetical protein